MTKERLKVLLAEYGRLAIITYFVLFVLVLAGFGVAFSFGLDTAVGMDVPDAIKSAGVLGAAYAATKLTQPLRILATLALTPLVARLLHRQKRARG